jgi:hypothetical protein
MSFSYYTLGHTEKKTAGALREKLKKVHRIINNTPHSKLRRLQFSGI